MLKSETPWMNVKEAAKYLRVSKETMYRMINEGRVPGYRLGKLWLFHRDELEQWVFSKYSEDKNAEV